MIFGLKWRAKWWLRRQIMCRFHHCYGGQIETNMGLGWHCGTCGRIDHWVKWPTEAQAAATDAELLTEQLTSIPQRSLSSVPSSRQPR